MSGCFDCPVMCGADREGGEHGVCGVGACSFVARAARHYCEEPPISGTRGSGTIFFVGCNMSCVFCQNREISRTGETPASVRTDAGAVAEMMIRLEALGAHNVNLVTPTPHAKLLEKAIVRAREEGLGVPIVWNTNGYELVDTLKRFEGLVDIYLPDLKYVSDGLSLKYSGRADYFEYAAPALSEMFRQVGNLELGPDGIAERGMIIRHLVLPCAVDETRRVLDHIAANYPKDVCVSIMSQYTPIEGMKKPLDRRLTKGEYERAVDYALSLGLTNIFIQKRTSASSEFTPDFNGCFE